MQYANFSNNGVVTRLGLLYPNIVVDYAEDAQEVHIDNFLIPFVGFSDRDFVELENGKLLILSPFQIEQTRDGAYVLRKGDEHKGYLMIMMSFYHKKDAQVFETPLASPPEKVIRFELKRDLDSSKYHEYIFIIQRDKKYNFGYFSESENSFVQVDLIWNYEADDLEIKITRPFI